MVGKIDLSFPEILLFCGTWILTSGNFGLGVSMCALGLTGAVFRAALRMHQAQLEEQARQNLLKEMNNAGEELGQAIMSLFKGAGSGSANVH